ncbi:EAL domain-containing protein [Agrilutibacter solisilvae]|uniref:EAL domain-containing protein n=1 Tax=Agrilutibacter solisilvae TaxID=2763317 RepID=A0A974Y0X7_9GAMM|nr:EAL domain-containing protein [Lysobacter solisilvae]QSX78405.1 EAL domain-containing protein [Lysobacter solisilvae]
MHAAHSAFEAQRRGELRSVSVQPDGRMRASRQGTLRLSATVLSRIRKGKVELHFQPIVPLAARDRTGVLAGEVLCRLRDDGGGLLYPHMFMAELQADRRTSELDLAVVRALDQWLREHRAQLPATAHISVNVTGQSLASREFAQQLLANLDDFALPMSMLCFEVTETAAITHVSDSMRLLGQLRERGCQIALDDFGVGFQSFERLKQLPITVVKIDGSFVRNMIRSPRDHALIEAAVHAAHAFGATTVAEFVEDAATAAALRDLGVDWAQGYFYGRPEPIDSILARHAAARVEA